MRAANHTAIILRAAATICLALVVALFTTGCVNDSSTSENEVDTMTSAQNEAESSEPEPLPAWTQIGPEEARSMMLEPGAVYTVLDVRTQQEYDEAHIEGAALLPYDLIDEASAASVIPNKDETVLAYCRSGRRSAIAAQALAELGYTNVYDFGGIGGWTYGTVASDSTDSNQTGVVPPNA